MAKTTRQLIYAALTKLGRLYVGEAPTDEDYQTVKDVVDPLVAALASDPRCGVLIEDIDAIEDRFFPSLALLVAVEVAPQFGTDAAQNLAANSGLASVEELKRVQMDNIRRMAARAPTYKVMQTQYF